MFFTVRFMEFMGYDSTNGDINIPVIIPAIILFIDPVILLIVIKILWAKNLRWIPCMLGVVAIMRVLFNGLILSDYLLPLGMRMNGLSSFAFLVFMEWLLIIIVPVPVLGMAMQIKRMNIRHNIPVSRETIGVDTNEIQEKGMLKVNCPACGKTLMVSQKHLHNTEKCKSCNTEFVPYEHIWY